MCVLQPVDRSAAESTDAEGKLTLSGAQVQQTVEETPQAELQTATATLQAAVVSLPHVLDCTNHCCVFICRPVAQILVSYRIVSE